MKLEPIFLKLSVALFFVPLATMADPLLSVGTTQGVPGSTIVVPINFVTDGTITGVNFDLLFSTNFLEVGTPSNGDAITNPLFFGSNVITNGDIRVLSIAFPPALASNGVFAFIPFTIASNAPDHDEPLTLTNVAATDGNGENVALPSSNGVLSIVIPPQITQIVSNGDGTIHLVLSGSANRNYAIQSTTNLSTPQWISFTNILPGPDSPFVDLTATNVPIRFYRAQAAP